MILCVRFFFSMESVIFLMDFVLNLVMFFLMILLLWSLGKRSKILTQKVVFIGFLLVLLLICTSCKMDSLPDDPFFQLYAPVSSVVYPVSSPCAVYKGSFFSFSASKVPFSLLSRLISDKFDVGLVFSESLSEKKITAEFKNSSLEDCLNVISRQLSSNVVKVGNTFFIGELRAEDRALLVRRIFGFSNEDLRSSVSGVLSDKGKISVISTGFVVVSDYSSVLLRVSELLDYLASSDSPVWIVQLCFLTINKEILIEGGVKVSTSGTISYNVSDSEFQLKDFNIDGLINAAMSSSFADVFSSPMLLVREGSSSSWKFGRRVPVPKRTVSNQGTVTVTGFDYVDVGFNVIVKLSRSSSGAVVEIEIGNSSIDSYVETSPVVSQNIYKFYADLVPLKAYLLGELSTFKDLNTQSDILNLGKTRGKGSVQVWGQVYPIRPGVRRSLPLKSAEHQETPSNG